MYRNKFGTSGDKFSSSETFKDIFEKVFNEEFKNEFNELKKMGKLDWDAEALVENYYDEIGKIVDKLEKLLNDEDLIFGNLIDDVNTGPGGVDASVTLGEVAEMNMTNQQPRFFEDL